MGNYLTFRDLGILACSCSSLAYAIYRLRDDYLKKNVKPIRKLKPGEKACVEGKLRIMRRDASALDNIYDKKTTYKFVKSEEMKRFQEKAKMPN